MVQSGIKIGKRQDHVKTIKYSWCSEKSMGTVGRKGGNGIRLLT